MTAGGEPGPAFAAGVLRSALAILRRHALAFAGLGAALGVLPGVGTLQALPYLLPSGDGNAGVDLPTVARGALGIALFTLAYFSATALDVAVVAVTLGRKGGRGDVLRLVGRALPINASCFVAILALGAAVPAALLGVVAASLGSWSILLPAFVAERPRLRDLPRRGLALVRRRPAAAAAIYACDLALASAIAGNALGFEPDYPLASAGDWIRAFAWSGAGFAVQIAADVAFTALYVALRRDEGAARDVAVASAFE